MPHSVIPMVYAMVVWSIVEKMQLARVDVPRTQVHRAGRVVAVAVAVLGLLLFVSLAVISVLALQLGGASV
jgi:hypothetical protein